MRCSSCEFDNAAGKRFCIRCGAALTHHCPKCSSENPPEASFCGDCGADLSQPTDAPGSAEPAAATVVLEHGAPHESPEGERRHLTLLFCDLVGSTEIASHLDPEEWRAIVGEYHRAAAQAIERFGGRVAQYLGDGVMAYFGYPEAHDNDAERAARAGLAILDAISKLNEDHASPKLAARVGIDSGAVVVGAGAGKETDVFGDTPNIAARVQAVAAPQTVLITADTYRLVSGLFVVEDHGVPPLKGVERSVQLYRVVRPSGVRSRLQATVALHGLTSFVGRENELRSLLDHWERARDGQGRAVLLIGEAGIGKSRLVQQFHGQVEEIPHTWVEAGAGALFQNTPFYALIQILHEFLAWREDESPERHLEQLERALELARIKPNEFVPLIAPLLDLPTPPGYPPLLLSPEQQRRRLLATLTDWTLGTAKVRPLIIVIEDLHWADPSTLELIQMLVEQCVKVPLLLVCTARPEFHAEQRGRAFHAKLTLDRLSPHNTRTMVEEVAARKALSPEIVATVIERTGGVPLFVEELTRSILESSSGRLTEHEIPATLHDSLMARLDRLGAAKEVAQLGAVIGSEFSYELIRAIDSLSEENLQGALRKLTEAELIYPHEFPPEATYTFKHALIRDAAYEALLKSRRKDLHRLVARTIDEKFPALKEAQPEVLARHWTQAGETELAIAEWSRAGKAAHARSAFSEALESYRQALALLGSLPESSERDKRELELRQSVHAMLWLARGPSEPETIDATERAASLAEKSGNLAQLIKSMIMKGNTALDSGDLPAAGTLADQALELALREGSPTSLGAAHALQMTARYYLGDLVSAEKHFTAGLTFFDDLGFMQAPGAPVGRFGFPSLNAWMLGRADVARDRMARAMSAANGNNPFDVAHSGYWAVRLHVYLREYEKAEALAARALELSEKHQFKLLAALSRVGLGEARAQLGRATESIGLISQGIAGLLEVGSRLGISRVTAILAEAQDRAGDIVGALKTIEQAFRLNPAELVYRPETLRLGGELQLKQGQTGLAEADFREAIVLAAKIGAKAWELRATMSLARLLARQGHRDEAHAILAEIYGWFTEGFDTADLKDARTLLDELAG